MGMITSCQINAVVESHTKCSVTTYKTTKLKLRKNHNKTSTSMNLRKKILNQRIVIQSSNSNTNYFFDANEHLQELKERLIITSSSFVISLILNLTYAKDLLLEFELNAIKNNFSFLQINPGEFFFTSFELASFFSLACIVPTFIYHLFMYLLPGITKKERLFLFPVLSCSILLFFAGIIFSFYILGPYALKFFYNYSMGSIESTLSIKFYFDFFLYILLITGLSFQIPIFQLLIVKLKICTVEDLKKTWKWFILLATTLSAVVTPTTDPITLCLTCAPLVFLYLFGIKLSNYVVNHI